MSVLTAPTPSLRASGALAGVLAGGAVAVSSALPVGGVAFVSLALGLVLAWGWPRLVNLPSPRGTSTVLALTAVALTATMVAGDAGDRTRWAGAVVSLGLIASFLHQLIISTKIK